MAKTYIIGGLLIAAFAALGVVGVVKSITPYVTVTQAKASPTTVQVKGALLKETIKFDDSGALNFTVKGEDGQEMKVIYHGQKPGNMEQATHVVAVGVYRDGLFRAEQVNVKCPSKYQGAGENK